MPITLKAMRAALAVTTVLGVVLAAPSASAARVEICHKDKTIKVSERSLSAHEAHGDYLGACEEVHTERLMRRPRGDGGEQVHEPDHRGGHRHRRGPGCQLRRGAAARGGGGLPADRGVRHPGCAHQRSCLSVGR